MSHVFFERTCFVKTNLLQKHTVLYVCNTWEKVFTVA